jgi:hypothetical protein
MEYIALLLIMDDSLSRGGLTAAEASERKSRKQAQNRGGNDAVRVWPAAMASVAVA